MYALAEHVWVAFLGRGLMGAGVQFGAATIHTYIGEMGTMMDDIRQKLERKPRKLILYIIYSFVLNGGFVVPYVVTSVMSTFQDVNPYRWPGWSVTALAAVLGTVVLLCFRETRSFPRPTITRKSCSGLKLSTQLKSRAKIRLMTYIFVIGCGYIAGKVYAILLTLVPPVLDNNFGFTVEYSSLFLLGVSAGFLSSSFIHLGAKFARVDNRILLGVCLVLTLLGALLVGDWQSTAHGNPCQMPVTTDCSNNLSLEITSGLSPLGDEDNLALNCSNISIQYLSFNERYVDTCESLGTDDNSCFWNQQSRVTGDFCNTCLPACLSRQATLNFYQFSSGVLLLSIAAPLGFVFTSAVASEITPLESQGTILSLLVGAGAFSRAVSPIWFVRSYDASGRHMYFAMGITAGCALVLLLLLVLLYNNLAPISSSGAGVVVTATSRLAVELENEYLSGNNEAVIDQIWTETPL
ncbi:hypothetical protein GBAR_LOCUS31827 [Geodia barretti]|uniref:Uncharacterized protein n=1 Tax=Geodia barretti TaxID=519541 RepID=A0AA35U412_GEOBA|nr:hypothetical protein GBAR_LOCUS31827 [Geodia barretti]